MTTAAHRKLCIWGGALVCLTAGAMASFAHVIGNPPPIGSALLLLAGCLLAIICAGIVRSRFRWLMLLPVPPALLLLAADVCRILRFALSAVH